MNTAQLYILRQRLKASGLATLDWQGVEAYRRGDGMDRKLRQHLDETRAFLDLNYDNGPHTDEDAYDHLAQECGKLDDGSCMYAGSEQCEFECPFR